MFERHTPLFFNYDHEPFWPLSKIEFGSTECEAAILLALFAAGDIPVSYSRNKNFYLLPLRYRSRLFTYAKVTQAVDRLDSLGLIDHHKMQPGNFGTQSWMTLTDEARAKIAQIVSLSLVPALQCETIILRNQNGVPCDYRECSETRRMRNRVKEFNECISGCDITGCLPCSLFRVFNRTLDRGGRFYTSGGWQRMNKSARSRLKIDGEPVIEIDFKTLHPALVYGQAGAAVPADCYELNGWPRSLVKVAFLILLNADSEANARAAIAQNKKADSVAKAGSRDAYSAASRLIADIKTRHSKVASAFHSDVGARLMRIDSAIAETAMHTLHKRGVVALPVHDSFLVKASKADELEEAMHKAAYKHGYPAIQTHREAVTVH